MHCRTFGILWAEVFVRGISLEIWDKVSELKPDEKGFQVFHRKLKIAKDAYRAEMANFPQPFKEEGFQDFVARYLQAKGDPGVVGMVRVEQRELDWVLDAAVRYPIEPEAQSAHFWSS